MTRKYTTEERRVRETDTEERPVRESAPRDPSVRVVTWFGEAIVRAVVVLLGLTVLLFAIGRIVGVDLLDTAVEVLDSGVAAWLLLAFFGLLLVLAATRSWSARRV